MREYIYDDRNSAMHSIMGMVVAGAFRQSLWLRLIGVLMMILFAIYETREPEPAVSTVGDFVEFIFGFIVGVMLFY